MQRLRNQIIIKRWNIGSFLFTGSTKIRAIECEYCAITVTMK